MLVIYRWETETLISVQGSQNLESNNHNNINNNANNYFFWVITMSQIISHMC